MSDLSCTLHALYAYPVKSCAGLALDRAWLCETGIDLDRHWMLVDEHGEFLSQRDDPRLALVQPWLRAHELVLRAPGMLALQLALDRVEERRRARLWDDTLGVFDMGALAAQWFSDFLGRGVRLVRFDPDAPRRSDRRWTGAIEAHTALSDGFALLVTSTASLAELNRRLEASGAPAVDMRRFRPNLVLDGVDAHAEDHIDRLDFDTPQGLVSLKLVKPCTRCTIPDVDPDSAATGHAVADTLAGYRADPRVGGAISFGMNAVIVDGVGCMLATGQAGRAEIGF